MPPRPAARGSSWSPSSALETGAGTGEERELFGGRGATENLVAVRVASETADHCGMFLGPLERPRLARVACKRAEQRERPLLHRPRLGMLERHVEEPALEAVQLAIEAARHRFVRRRQRRGIARERERRASVDIARELIEDHDAGERAARCRAPVAEGAGERSGDVVAEALADLRIELIVLAEPCVANGMRRGA